ncbi:MAG: hypothetical protein P4L46_06145 [Fimbriimonas sp.]|nr:hypothetical protein [Fimbriimonas sp.]
MNKKTIVGMAAVPIGMAALVVGASGFAAPKVVLAEDEAGNIAGQAACDFYQHCSANNVCGTPTCITVPKNGQYVIRTSTTKKRCVALGTGCTNTNTITCTTTYADNSLCNLSPTYFPSSTEVCN